MTVETATSPIVGANTDRRTLTQEFRLGTAFIDTQARTWTYGQASEAVATGTCTLSASFVITDTGGAHTADTVFAINEYGWVRRTTSPI